MTLAGSTPTSGPSPTSGPRAVPRPAVPAPTPARPPHLVRTARLTGLAYLGLAVSGLLGLLVVRGQLYVPDDAAATAANLVAQESLARLGTVLDLTVVLTQALAAVAFFALGSAARIGDT